MWRSERTAQSACVRTVPGERPPKGRLSRYLILLRIGVSSRLVLWSAEEIGRVVRFHLTLTCRHRGHSFDDVVDLAMTRTVSANRYGHRERIGWDRSVPVCGYSETYLFGMFRKHLENYQRQLIASSICGTSQAVVGKSEYPYTGTAVVVINLTFSTPRIVAPP